MEDEKKNVSKSFEIDFENVRLSVIRFAFSQIFFFQFRVSHLK